jgi:hypothetical protein
VKHCSTFRSPKVPLRSNSSSQSRSICETSSPSAPPLTQNIRCPDPNSRRQISLAHPRSTASRGPHCASQRKLKVQKKGEEGRHHREQLRNRCANHTKRSAVPRVSIQRHRGGSRSTSRWHFRTYFAQDLGLPGAGTEATETKAGHSNRSGADPRSLFLDQLHGALAEVSHGL